MNTHKQMFAALCFLIIVVVLSNTFHNSKNSAKSPGQHDQGTVTYQLEALQHASPTDVILYRDGTVKFVVGVTNGLIALIGPDRKMDTERLQDVAVQIERVDSPHDGDSVYGARCQEFVKQAVSNSTAYAYGTMN